MCIRDRAWIAIYYGQDRDPAKRLRLEQDRQTIVLFETQQTTEKQITIVKYSEAEYAACGIVSIEITDEVNPGEEILLSPPVHKKRQIAVSYTHLDVYKRQPDGASYEIVARWSDRSRSDASQIMYSHDRSRSDAPQIMHSHDRSELNCFGTVV